MRVPKVVAPNVHERKTLAVDFDGVVHAYSRGWQGGEVYDEPVPHAAEGLRQLHKRFRLVLFTARTNLDDVHQWLVTHGLRHLFEDLTNTKPQAVAYLDDRAVKFTDWPNAVLDLGGSWC